MASCVPLTGENLNCMMMIMVTQLKVLGYQFKTKSIRKLSNWAIPENIHSIPRTAFRISEGEGGFTIMEF